MTINRLGVTGSLTKSLESTNPVESMIEIVRDHAPPGEALQRRGDGPALGRHGHAGRRGPVRRVKGYRQLDQLAHAPEHATADEPGPLDLAATA